MTTAPPAAPVESAKTAAIGNSASTATADDAVATPQVAAEAAQPDLDQVAPAKPSGTQVHLAPASAAAASNTASATQHPPHAGARALPWLLLLALGLVLLAWRASMRRGRQLAQETERLSRQQRHLKSAHAHLQQKSEKLQRLSMHDPLTSTLNRQAFAAELRDRIDHLAKYNQPLSLIMFDLDHFKAINDRYGHLLGDAALNLVVGVVREHLVSDDVFGRFGGDEFMIACPGQNVQSTAALAETLRTAVARRAAEATPPIPGLTLSLGLAQADPVSGYQPDELFARADAALYRAKQRGRNSVVVADPCDAQLPEAGGMRRHL